MVSRPEPEIWQAINELAQKLRPPSTNPRDWSAYTAQYIKLGHDYGEQSPPDREAILALAQVPLYIEARIRLKDAPPEVAVPLLLHMTEQLFLTIHVALTHDNDPKYMRNFWRAAHLMARTHGIKRLPNGYQNSILTTVGIFRALEAIGRSPQLSHPRQDAFHAIDLWLDSDSPVQLKSTTSGSLSVHRTNTKDFPKVQLDNGKSVTLSPEATYHRDFRRFSSAIQRYSQKTRRPLRGYYIRVPLQSVQPLTGRPTKKLIQQLRQKLA